MKNITFALYFGNRGFFPGESIDGAREEMKKAVRDCGFDYILLDTDKTRYGAVETKQEGACYAEFLEENRGRYQGVIVCLPNFGDENGALVALKNAGVPILIQAYPDEIGKMDFAHRRDAMCGKFAMCNVLRQANIPFSLTEKFVVAPGDDSFKEDLLRFGAICRVVDGMKSFCIGAIGARTTAFKTVRVDETALESKGISVEAFDMSEVFYELEKVTKPEIDEKIAEILEITEFSGYPESKLEKMARLQVVLENYAEKYSLDAMAIRCWHELEVVWGIAPCTNLGLLNEKGIAAACEVDIPNAVMMRALALASNSAGTLLDFNNNYGDADDKVIMFHCGPMPISMLEGKGKTIEHLMFKKSYGEGTGVGVNKGVIRSGDITFGSIKTENGRICAFVSDGKFTDDEIEESFFGSGKVVMKKGIYDIANYMSENGYKHHVCIVHGSFKEAVAEAFDKYLGYDVKVF